MNNKTSKAKSSQFAQLEDLIREVSEIRSGMLDLETNFDAKAAHPIHEAHQKSARNLLHYLALRRRDIRQLQEELASLGLSSLGRTESHALGSVNAVLEMLYRITNPIRQTPAHLGSNNGFANGKALLGEHTEKLLGPKPHRRDVRIMVTMPSEAAGEYQLVKELLAHGMDCMRINCAYDNPDSWARMIRNLERARQKTGKACRILMDLAGPKLRLGPVEGGPQVVKWRPRRDTSGNVKSPARLWLTSIESPASPPEVADACLPVPAGWLANLCPGDTIKFFDTRGSSRFMTITERSGEGRWAESAQTTYMASGTVLQISRTQATGPVSTLGDITRVGELHAKPQAILLKKSDTLMLTSSLEPGRPAVFDERGKLISPARIGVTLPEIFSDVQVGESVWLDDGKVGGVIRSVNEEEIEVEITHARVSGERLLGDKGINLPDSHLRLPALTEKDLKDLPFVARHADLVGYSFVRSETDVYQLQSRLAELGGDHLGIVLKIETRKAFEQLPSLLLAAMRSPCSGVMIARGDLAVECGYERMAEVQEEILWFAEAAHMPVIWATQVLERLAKEGLPSRAEITDAAMGERAECVMLNKGPYIVEAVRTLDDILRRMQSHQSKKRAMLRHLSIADGFFEAV